MDVVQLTDLQLPTRTLLNHKEFAVWVVIHSVRLMDWRLILMNLYCAL